MRELGKPKLIVGVRVEFVKNGFLLSQRQCIQEIESTLLLGPGHILPFPYQFFPHSLQTHLEAADLGSNRS